MTTGRQPPTVDCTVDEVWKLLTSRTGVGIRLGAGARLGPAEGAVYETGAGTAGEIRSWRPLDRRGLAWQPAHWDHESTVQVAVSAHGEKTAVTFRQERLANRA